MSMYLCHHGIIGMKWGVRRYQQSDGTWTEQGLARRRIGGKYVPAGNMKEYLNSYKIRNNVVTADSDFDTVARANSEKRIKKGTPIYRASNAIEKKDTIDRRKYGSITQHGAKKYQAALFNNELNDKVAGNKPAFLSRYEAKKDLKVVPIKELKDYAIEMYKKNNVSKNGKDFTDKLSSEKIDDIVKEYVDDGINYKEATKLISHFKDLGYDVIPDYVDMGNYKNLSGAMIFVNPSESMKLTDTYLTLDRLNPNSIYDGKAFLNDIGSKGIEKARETGQLDKYRLKRVVQYD